MIEDRMKNRKNSIFEFKKCARKRAFTLVEIIISLSLLAVVALIFASFLSYAFYQQARQKEITQGAFAVQKGMERAMEEARMGAITDVARDVFGKQHDVYYKQIVGEDPTYQFHKFYTLVTKEGRIKEEVPEALSSSIVFRGVRADHEHFEYIPLKSGSTDIVAPYKLEGKFELNASKSKDVEYTLVRWYASSPGYIVPKVKGIQTGTFYEIYPDYPDNFELVHQEVLERVGAGKKSVEFSGNLSDYAGRHILLSITPVTKYGVFGKSAVSSYVYVHRLKNLENLVFHLDANAIKSKDVNAGNVLKWADISKSEKNGVVLPATGGQAVFVAGHPGTSYNGHSVLLKKGSSVSTDFPNPLGDVTIFAVTKGNFTKNNLILDGIYPDSFHPVHLVGGSGGTGGSSNFQLNVFQGRHNGGRIGFHALSGSSGADIEVVEFLVYSGKMFTVPGEINQPGLGAEMVEYSKDKFRLANVEFSVLERLLNFTLQAVPGTTFVPPNEVTGLFQDKRRRLVKVVWTETERIEPINLTGQDKIYTFKGHALGEPTKTVTMTVVMPPRELALDIILTATRNVVYSASGNETEVKYQVKAKPGETIPSGFVPSLRVYLNDTDAGKLQFIKDGKQVDELILNQLDGSFKVVSKKTGNVDIQASLGSSEATVKVFANDAVANFDASERTKKYMEIQTKSSVDYVTKWKDISGHHNHFNRIRTYRSGHETWYDPSLDATDQKSILFRIQQDDGLYCERFGNISFEKPQGTERTDSTIVIVSKAGNKAGTMFSYSYDEAEGTNVSATNYEIRIDGTSSNSLSVGNGGSYELKKKVSTVQLNQKHILVVTNQNDATNPLNYFKTSWRVYNKEHSYDAGTEQIRLTNETRNSGFTIGGRYLKGRTEGQRCFDSFSGHIYEVMVFDRVLSNEEITQLVGYLRKKWFK